MASVNSILYNMAKLIVLISLLAFAAVTIADHTHYKFEYGVNDPHTHDIKNQWESRDGDQVKGSYSLVEPDGTLRVVEYHADGHNGFNAIVKRTGHGHHPQVTYHGYGYGL